MLRVSRLVVVSIAAACLAGCVATTNPLVGSWRLVSSGGEPVSSSVGAPPPVKILSDARFAFGTMHSGGEVWAGGGRYEYANGAYTEIVEYHSLPYLVGRRVTFQCELEGDLWYHSGGADAEGNSLNVNEVWQRIGNANAPAGNEPRRDTVRRR